MNREEIEKEYRLMHKANKFRGVSLRKHMDEINEIIEEEGIDTLLDYGCGGACHVGSYKASSVSLYDPYNEKYEKKPTGTFEMVVCTDVLEHVIPEDIFDVVADIISYAEKVVYLSIATYPASKKFKDGTNVHLLVRSQDWWDQLLDSLSTPEIKIVRKYT